MMQELKSIQQDTSTPYIKRCFMDTQFDLTVWLSKDQNQIACFQLCYQEGIKKKSLNWKQGSGLIHHLIDDGEDRPGRHKMSSVFFKPERFTQISVLKKFLHASLSIAPDISHFVLDTIQKNLPSLTLGECLNTSWYGDGLYPELVIGYTEHILLKSASDVIHHILLDHQRLLPNECEFFGAMALLFCIRECANYPADKILIMAKLKLLEHIDKFKLLNKHTAFMFGIDWLQYQIVSNTYSTSEELIQQSYTYVKSLLNQPIQYP
ncbi:MAG: hypothetical protein HQK77_19520 [Desulfobacterales bacterium]|nr:hypothetical protein [Desulfobacterales bacterium]